MSYVTPNEKPDPRTDTPTPEETPLTEAHLFGARGGDCVTEVKAVVRANFARRLERENTALRAHAERLEEELKLEVSAKLAISDREIAVIATANEWADKCYAVEAHAERLAEACQELNDACDKGNPMRVMELISKANETARQALILYRAENPKV